MIGVIGGSGFYSLFESDVRSARVTTPYGDPSAPITVGMVGRHEVAFLPRHGVGHEYAPHTVPYRANMWAMRALGVRQIFGPCAVGSLSAELPAGTVVVPDQLVDRTNGRADTYFDGGAIHIGFADPYCPDLRSAFGGLDGVVDGGTMVVIQGPRFSTRAESQWYAQQGFTLINMTGYPEAALARELEMCYAAIALVTDLDAGVEAGSGVRAVDVFAEFERNLASFKRLLLGTIETLPAERTCAHCLAHDGVDLPFELPSYSANSWGGLGGSGGSGMFGGGTGGNGGAATSDGNEISLAHRGYGGAGGAVVGNGGTGGNGGNGGNGISTETAGAVGGLGGAGGAGPSPGASGENGIAILAVGNNPLAIAYDPNFDRLYVGNASSQTVSALDATSGNARTAVIQFGNSGGADSPLGIAFNPAANVAYASTTDGSGNPALAVINSSNNSVSSYVTLPGNGAVAVRPNGTSVWVTSENKVSVINTTTHVITATVSVPGAVGIGFTTDGSQVYVSQGESQNAVTILDANDPEGAANIVSDPLNTFNVPRTIAFSRTTARAFVVNWGNDSVSMINTDTAAVISSISVGQDPWGIAVSPDGTKVYVATMGSNTVSVIDTSGAGVEERVIPVGPNPYGVAVSADGAYLYVTTDDNRGGGSPGKVWVIRL